MYMMIRRIRSVAVRAFVAVAALVTLGGCATKGDIRDLQTELVGLAARQDAVLAQLQMEALSTQDTLRTQSNQIFDFRGDITRQLRLISESLNRIEALAGENQRGVRGVRDQLENMRTQQRTVPRGQSSDSSAVVEGIAPGGGDTRQLYNTARDQYNRGSLNTARMAFEQFLQAAPNDDFAPEAQYYLADILEQQGDLDEALAAFGEIQSRFPAAEKVPDSLYRMARIHVEQENEDEAIDLLERVINTYPMAIIAEIAAELLDEIR
jgi:tol-pal system protein YbgF